MNSLIYNHREVQAYEDSLKSYRDLKNSLDTAFAEGVEEGIEQGIEQGIERGIERVALNGIQRGLDNKLLIELTGLSEVQIEYLREKFEEE